MDEQRSSRIKVWTPLIFSLIMILGMVLGFNLRDTLRSKRDIQTIIERNDRLEQIIDLISEKYVDSVNKNVLYEDAVGGILSHLDPHTVYITPDQLQSVNEDLEGSFFGIGVEFSIVRDTILVTSIIESGPAQRAGVDIGDQLIKVGDSIVAGTGITSDRIIKMLRGKEHSKVLVTIKPSINDSQKKVIIERGAIPLYSLEANVALDNNTGYIKINRFSATTYEEFAAALKSLKAKGIQSLILDLRQNPGGYLDAAINIVDEVLAGEKLVVYTQGKRSPRTEYKTSKKGVFEDGKIAILVDESSASASEIIAGAVQDWDRGIVIGRRTYGKGLVQEQFELNDGSALRLTVARYYTPSGRSIQRSYAKGKESYAKEISSRFETGELTGYDTLQVGDTAKYYTAGKRPVFGGGGITPDVYVPYDTLKFNERLISLIFSEDTRNVLWDYFLQRRNQLREHKSVEEFDANFKTDDLLKTFANATPEKMQPHFRKILQNPHSKNYFELQLKAQLARFLFRNNGFYAIASQGDQMIQRALQALNDKSYFAIIDSASIRPRQSNN